MGSTSLEVVQGVGSTSLEVVQGVGSTSLGVNPGGPIDPGLAPGVGTPWFFLIRSARFWFEIRARTSLIHPGDDQ